MGNTVDKARNRARHVIAKAKAKTLGQRPRNKAGHVVLAARATDNAKKVKGKNLAAPIDIRVEKPSDFSPVFKKVKGSDDGISVEEITAEASATAFIQVPQATAYLRQDEHLEATMQLKCGGESETKKALHSLAWDKSSGWGQVGKGKNKKKQVKDYHTVSLYVMPMAKIVRSIRQDAKLSLFKCDWTVVETFTATTRCRDKDNRLLARRQWGFRLQLSFDSSKKTGSGALKYNNVNEESIRQNPHQDLIEMLPE